MVVRRSSSVGTSRTWRMPRPWPPRMRTRMAAVRPVRVGVEIAAMLNKLYGAKFELEAAERLFGSKDGITRIRGGADPGEIVSSWAAGEARWRLLRAKYLLYR